MSKTVSPQTVQRVKRWAIGLGVVAYIGAAAFGTVYGSAALYQLLHKQRPNNLSLTTTRDYWRLTATNLPERKKLYLAIGIPAAALFVFLPLLLASIGPKRRELHGSARFANRMEIEKAGLLTGKGIILGKFNGKFITLPGQQSVFLGAPTRSGKGVGVVVPNLLAWPDSTCVLDIKSELFEITAGFRAAHGQRVYAWAPFAPDGRTHRYNPLSYVRTEYRHVVGDIRAISQIIYATSANASGTEIFFNEQASDLFLGLALYLVETPELPRTIGELLRQSSGNGKPLKDHLKSVIEDRIKAGRPFSDRCIDALMRFLGAPDNLLGNIVSTFNAPLTEFVNPLVDAATSGDDFLLTDLRRQRMSVYVCIPPNRLSSARVLINLFFAQLVNLNTDELPEHNPALKYQCLIVPDEFTAMGRIPAFSKGIGYMAGYGLRCLTIVQTVSQLDATYGREEARNFITNHAAQITFAPRDQRDANEYSEMLGTLTELSEAKGRSSSHGGRGGGSSTSTNVSPQARALLKPQEIKEIGIDKEVIFVENVKPILADKIVYHRDPVFMSRLMKPPVLPEIDLELYRARVEQRVRTAVTGEVFTLDHFAANWASLPTLAPDADSTQLTAFVSAFFALLAVEQTIAHEQPAEEIAL